MMTDATIYPWPIAPRLNPVNSEPKPRPTLPGPSELSLLADAIRKRIESGGISGSAKNPRLSLVLKSVGPKGFEYQLVYGEQIYTLILAKGIL